MIALLLLAACNPVQDAIAPARAHAEESATRPGVESLREAEEVFALGNPEQSRVLVERAIEQMLRDRPELADDEDDRTLREAGALAYKLRSLQPARRAWDAVRRYRERTLDPDSREVQNARGNVSWIGEQMGLVAEARVLEEAILAALEKTVQPDDEALSFARSNLADTLMQQDEDADRALALMRQVAESRRAALPPGHKKRLRAELDLACGWVGVGEFEKADEVVERVLAECPAALTDVRVRAASDLVWIRAARGDRDAFGAAIEALARELSPAQDPMKRIPWRESEIQRAEVAPFVDLLISAALGLGVFPAEDAWVALAARRIAENQESDRQPVVFHRFERSRIVGEGRDRRVLADERMGAAVFPALPVEGDEGEAHARTADGRWIDIGSLEDVRGLVRALDAALVDGQAVPEADRVARAIFAPVAQALGDPHQLRFVPDDVLWAVPMDVVELRHDADRVTTLVPMLVVPARHIALVLRDRVVLGDPTPKNGHARSTGSNQAASAGGAAHAYIPPRVASTKELTDAFGRLSTVETLRGDDADRSGVWALPAKFQDIVLTTPVWSSPDAVPCLTTPRSIASSSSLSAVMSREDVVGGSSPADLCGFLFSDFAAEPGADQRVTAAPRAADLRELGTAYGPKLLVAAPPPRADVLLRARDIEALARALFAGGFTEVGFATQSIRDLREVALRGAFHGVPDGAPDGAPQGPGSREGERVRGPWLRVAAGW